MARSGFQPDWREDVPAARSYRSILTYDSRPGAHPSRAWVEMFKRELGMSDDDFRTRQAGGDAPVALARPCALASAQLDALAAIVGADNVSTDDYDRARFGHGKSVDENLALRRGMVTHAPDCVVRTRATRPRWRGSSPSATPSASPSSPTAPAPAWCSATAPRAAASPWCCARTSTSCSRSTS
ncbi:MAG: hypothetical protein U0802_01855 [Candidatus Binatia bacterium]